MTQTLPWSVQQIVEWLPFAKAASFFLATFVVEDVAAVGAGLLLATGGISWPAAFGACFLGIWMGDVGLYALARCGGRGWFEHSSLSRFGANVTESEGWFAKRGTLILIFSRLLPGTRLPTYLAAGFLRLPLPRFLIVTGTASFVWTLAVLWLAQTLGVRLVHWLSAYKHGGLLLLGGGVAVFGLIRSCRRKEAGHSQYRKSPLPDVSDYDRLCRWEFWPAWLFYAPVGIYCLWLAVKYRGLGLPTAANPGMFSGGIIGESKAEILNELFLTSPGFTAEAAFVSGETFEARLRSLNEILTRLKIDYPFILKPNVGQRGVGVKLIHTREQAEDYLRRTSAPLVAQRYAPGPFELGVFYYRFPHEQRGHIFAVTEKIFPVLVGNEQSTISELIRQDPRARFMAHTYLRRFESRRNEILPGGKMLKLVEAGNHAQGCIFRDGMHLCTPALVERIDEISKMLSGFYIGRYDIRFESEADLRAGKNFQIIELNGAASEATSIYDARNSLFDAYRTLFRQWDLVFAIGAANRKLGVATIKLSVVWHEWRRYSRLSASYPVAD
jgi:membrane protein DedA with SNARE-associated domain